MIAIDTENDNNLSSTEQSKVSPIQHPAVTRARKADAFVAKTEWPPLPRRRISSAQHSRVFRVLSRRNSFDGLNESYLVVPFARTDSGSSLSTLSDMISELEN